MLDEQKIRQIIREEIATSTGSSRFQLGPVQRHTHNNVDSPQVFTPVVSYAGIVDSAVTLNPLLPLGWKAVRTSLGLYEIVHNLNNISTGNITYSVTVTAIGTAGLTSFISMEPQRFYVSWMDPVTTTQTDTDFSFTVVNTVNANPSYYSYTLLGT